MKLTRSFIIYTALSFMSASIPFFLLPVLTNCLSKKDYGIITLFITTVSLILPFISVGIPQLIAVNYFKKSEIEFKKEFSSSLFFISLFALFAFVLLFRFQKPIKAILNFDSNFLFFIPLVCVGATFIEILYVLFRNKEKVKEYAVLCIIQTVAEAGITLTLILVLFLKWEVKLTSTLVMSTLFVFFSLIKFYK